MITLLEAKDIKTVRSKGIRGGILHAWIAIKHPNGNTIHNVRRRYVRGMQYYESDRFAFSTHYTTMERVKQHAADFINDQTAQESSDSKSQRKN